MKNKIRKYVYRCYFSVIIEKLKQEIIIRIIVKTPDVILTFEHSNEATKRARKVVKELTVDPMWQHVTTRLEGEWRP